MHKELIGQEASLTLPCSVDATALLLGFVEELMEVSGSETGEPERLEGDLRAAVAAICRTADSPGTLQVVATFAIRDDGVDVRLAGTDQDASIGEQLVVAHEV